jgi:hypothetical protein
MFCPLKIAMPKKSDGYDRFGNIVRKLALAFRMDYESLPDEKRREFEDYIEEVYLRAYMVDRKNFGLKGQKAFIRKIEDSVETSESRYERRSDYETEQFEHLFGRLDHYRGEVSAIVRHITENHTITQKQIAGLEADARRIAGDLEGIPERLYTRLDELMERRERSFFRQIRSIVEERGKNQTEEHTTPPPRLVKNSKKLT